MNAAAIAALSFVVTLIGLAVGAVWLAIRCDHTWETVDKFDVTEYGQVKARVYVQRCRSCGRLRRARM